ncbi:hypothetical protein PR048_031757 [Dryococelus australis]|uniref:Uncharacterized protein n=1 Tax=Dryococelus australis TaxID=614101 RepID=A0ABQ9G6T3_9NEOP|nr:hypothetical protein PR048_031757 [Dryococelus australis]
MNAAMAFHSNMIQPAAIHCITGCSEETKRFRTYGGGEREIPEKTHRQTASSGTIPTCENPVTLPAIEPGSSWWEASGLTARKPRPQGIRNGYTLTICTSSVSTNVHPSTRRNKGCHQSCTLADDWVNKDGSRVSLAANTIQKWTTPAYYSVRRKKQKWWTSEGSASSRRREKHIRLQKKNGKNKITRWWVAETGWWTLEIKMADRNEIVDENNMVGGPSACKAKWNNIRDQYRKTIRKRKTSTGKSATNIRKYKYEPILQFIVPHLNECDPHSKTSFSQEWNEGEEGDFCVEDNPEDENYPQERCEDATKKGEENPDFPNNKKKTTQQCSQIQQNQSKERDLAKPSHVKENTFDVISTSCGSGSDQRTLFFSEGRRSEKRIMKEHRSQREHMHAVDAFLAGISPTLKTLNPVLLNQAKSRIFSIVQELEMKQLLGDQGPSAVVSHSQALAVYSNQTSPCSSVSRYSSIERRRLAGRYLRHVELRPSSRESGPEITSFEIQLDRNSFRGKIWHDLPWRSRLVRRRAGLGCGKFWVRILVIHFRDALLHFPGRASSSSSCFIRCIEEIGIGGILLCSNSEDITRTPALLASSLRGHPTVWCSAELYLAGPSSDLVHEVSVTVQHNEGKKQDLCAFDDCTIVGTRRTDTVRSHAGTGERVYSGLMDYGKTSEDKDN